MKKMLQWSLAATVSLAAHGHAQAELLADSVAEFSATQGANNWYYGFYNQTAGGAYSSAGFVPFAEFSTAGDRWQATAAQVGVNNIDFLSTNRVGGHPNGVGPGNQDAAIWAMRRYVSEVAGPIRVDFDLHKLNVGNPLGGGITGHIFLNGTEVFSRFIANDDDVGAVSSLTLNVAVGSFIDFALDPTGVSPAGSGENIASARADGSYFSALISTAPVPEPSSAWLMLIGLGLAPWLRKRQHGRR